MNKDETKTPNPRFMELLKKYGHAGLAQDELHREQIPEDQRCDRCGGTGNQLYSMYQQCEKCKGTGKC